MNEFEKTIKAYLDELAERDSLFAKAYAKDGKSIGKCCKYIVAEAKKKAFNTSTGQMSAISDDEVYSMAVHYYHEDNVEVAEDIKAEVVTPKQKRGRKSKAEPKKPQVESSLAIEIPLFEI